MDEVEALRIAKSLIEAGIPVFAAPPCPPGCRIPGHEREEFHRPKHWQKTIPSKVWLDPTTPNGWRPGYALAMVGGWLADVVDEDPRSGGDASIAELRAAGEMPRVFGVQATPSGGRHHVIGATGLAECNGFMPGLDLQSGKADGQGRGYAWIAPTIKRSKNPADAGALRTYTWIEPPDLEALAAAVAAEKAGTSSALRLDGLRRRVAGRDERRRAERAERSRSNSVGQPGDPFLGVAAASQLFAGSQGGTRSGNREFTEEQARTFLTPFLVDLQQAPIGQIEERCNAAAASLSHFVPEFWTAEQGMALLRDALASTAYDEAHPASAWTVEKFRPVLDGRRPTLDPWRAVRVEPVASYGAYEASELHSVRSEPSPEPAGDEVEALIAEMLSLSEVAQRPAPQYLIKGVLNLDSESWMIGAPGSKKSFVALDMACHVAAGKPWQGRKVTKADVIIIAAEGAGGLGKRVKAWEMTHGGLPAGVRVLPRPVQAADVKGWAVLVEACRRLLTGPEGETRPALVVIDTQARVTVGLEENDATAMGFYVAAVSAIKRATAACVLTVHHTGRKGGDARGSSAIDGAQDTELKVESEGLSGRLLTEKQKDIEQEEPIPLAFVSVPVGVDEDGEPITSLALSGDPYVAAAREMPEVVEEWQTGHGPVIVQIFKVLRDQGGSVGLTRSDTKQLVMERFYAKATRPLSRSSFATAWTRCREMVSEEGDLVMTPAGGERWAVDVDALAKLRPGKYNVST